MWSNQYQWDSVSKPILLIPGRMPLVWGRTKSDESRAEKTTQRRIPLLDQVGWRTGYLDRADLQRVQSALDPMWRVSVNWCKQHVWYYYYDHSTELQVWPWTYLHCFYLNHGTGVHTNLQRQFAMQEAIEGIELEEK
jgi:hypothetical protein